MFGGLKNIMLIQITIILYPNPYPLHLPFQQVQ